MPLEVTHHPCFTESAIKRIAYYISSHGYGHAVRSTAVLDQLVERYRVTVKTDLSTEAFKLWPPAATLIEQQVDAGCTQNNFIEINPGKAFASLRHFYQTRQ